jgi:hypothetical protein
MRVKRSRTQRSYAARNAAETRASRDFPRRVLAFSLAARFVVFT